MKRFIELKHVKPKQHVRGLLEELIERLEERLSHFPPDAVSLHVVFEENGTHTLFRTSVSCHFPHHMVAAHEEARDPGLSIREAFAELERQIEKHKALFRREPMRHRTRRAAGSGLVGLLVLAGLLGARPAWGELSDEAAQALQLAASSDRYQQQIGFLRLEALRDPATLKPIKQYLTHPDPYVRAFSLRAVAAIEGPAAAAILLKALARDRSAVARRAALLGLEPFLAQDPQILPAFIQALKDRTIDVRIAAVDAVSRSSAPEARAAILARCKRERKKDVRRVLELAKNRMGLPRDGR